MTAANRTANIMVIDDEPENLRVLETLIIRQGYSVRSFSSGSAALRSARLELPDLILLDIRMPEMDGFAVCRQLKSIPDLCDIPVIFITAYGDIGEKVRGFEMGAADFITKPYFHEEVLARLNTHLTVRRYHRELEEKTRQLENMNLMLEQRVQERTAELIKTNRDLTRQIEDRMAAEAALMESEAQFRRIVTTANEGIIATDTDFRIAYANDMMAELLGGTVDQVMGRSVYGFIHEEDRAIQEKHLQERALGHRDIYEIRMRRLDGKSRWMMVAASPIFDNDNRFQGSIALLTDITDRKQSELDLRQAYAEISELKQQIEADKIYLQEEIKLEHNFDEIIGASDEIKYALYRVEQVAGTDSAVIIFGETGTGKELFARALHSTGSRASRPLIKVNCAALPEQLIESELFGHDKGAFTGAARTRQGRFELAHRGTLFLDEIGELPAGAQVKLLRVLQDGEFERLGSSRTIKTDVRVIAATNRDLEAMLAAGKFRKDLWYRLNVFPITIPPLRRRSGDIPLLVSHFVDKICKKVGKQITRIPKQVMDELSRYDWPGNVRELEHVIERAILTTQGQSLRLSERLNPSTNPGRAQTLKTHADTERDHIRQVLESTGWVVEGPGGAARILDLRPSTLRYRIKKLGIRKPIH